MGRTGSRFWARGLFHSWQARPQVGIGPATFPEQESRAFIPVISYEE